MIKNLENYADILAIPFFILLTYYFIIKSNKNNLEYMLMIFAIIGVIADFYFSINFLYSK